MQLNHSHKILIGKAWIIVLCASILIGGLLLTLAMIRLNVVKGSYRLQQDKQMMNKLAQEIAEKEVEHSELLTPSKIESLAAQKFHLAKPTPQQIIYFKSQE